MLFIQVQQELVFCRVIGSEEEAHERRARMHEKGPGEKAKWKKSEVTRGEQQAKSKDQQKLCKWKAEHAKGNSGLYRRHFVSAAFTQRVNKAKFFYSAPKLPSSHCRSILGSINSA